MASIKNTKRKVIIHKHLFKNAGTTFDWSLKKNFGDAFCDHRDDKPMIKVGEPYLLKYLDEHPKIKALSSHHIWFHLSQNKDYEFIPIYILRHPIERIKSVYNFEKIQQSNSLGATMAKKMTFVEYVEWRMNYNIPDTIRNFQTRICSGIKTGNQLTSKHYDAAIEELKNSKFVGIVDMYEESMKIFEMEFDKIGLSLDLSFVPQNVNQSIKNIDYNDRAKLILDELGDSLANEVQEKNKYDIELYHFAKSKLKRRLKLLSNEN